VSARRWRLRPRFALVLVLAAFVTLSLSVAVLTPPWEANDEPDHVQNVETLVAGHLYRIQRGVGARIELHQPPLYYLALAAWQRLFHLRSYRPAPVIGCNIFAAALTHRACVLLFRHDLPTEGRDQRRIDLLRLPGILLGALAVVLTAVAARRVSRDPWTPVVAAATVAFVPRFVFLCGVVNNDNLANALAAAATVLAMVAVTLRSDSWRDHVLVATGLGAVLGALILTKETALALALGMALAGYLSAPNRRAGLRLAAIVGVVALLVSSPWLIHNTVSYGDPLALGATRSYLRHQQPQIFVVGSASKVLFVTIPREFFKGFWYQSGWPIHTGGAWFEWPWWAYIPFWLLTFAAAAGLLLGRRRPEAPPRNARSRQRKAIVSLAALLLPSVATVWILGLNTSTSQARLALIGLPALACLVALGLERYRLPVAARFALPVLGVVGTIIAIQHDVVDISANFATVKDGPASVSRPRPAPLVIRPQLRAPLARSLPARASTSSASISSSGESKTRVMTRAVARRPRRRHPRPARAARRGPPRPGVAVEVKRAQEVLDPAH
jgi:hypothetical protein